MNVPNSPRPPELLVPRDFFKLKDLVQLTPRQLNKPWVFWESEGNFSSFIMYGCVHKGFLWKCLDYWLRMKSKAKTRIRTQKQSSSPDALIQFNSKLESTMRQVKGRGFRKGVTLERLIAREPTPSPVSQLFLACPCRHCCLRRLSGLHSSPSTSTHGRSGLWTSLWTLLNSCFLTCLSRENNSICHKGKLWKS